MICILLEPDYIFRDCLSLLKASNLFLSYLLAIKVSKDLLYFLDENMIPYEYDYNSFASIIQYPLLIVFVFYKIDYINLCLIENNSFKIIYNIYDFSSFEPEQILIE
jgi:hypothetical protein